jgi:hypothetical protein
VELTAHPPSSAEIKNDGGAMPPFPQMPSWQRLIMRLNTEITLHFAQHGLNILKWIRIGSKAIHFEICEYIIGTRETRHISRDSYSFIYLILLLTNITIDFININLIKPHFAKLVNY